MSAIKKYKSDIVNLQKEYPDFETFIKKKEKYCTDKVKELLFDKHLMQKKTLVELYLLQEPSFGHFHNFFI